MSKTPRNMVDLNDDSGDESMSLIKQEAKVLVNKVDTQKQIDRIIKDFKKTTLTRKEPIKFARPFRKGSSKTYDIESEIKKITATAEVRLTRGGKQLTSGYQDHLSKINSIFSDIQNASSRLEVDEVEKTLKYYKGVVETTKNLSKKERKEIKNIITETEYAAKAVRDQKLSRSKIFITAVKDNLPDIAGLTAAVFGDNPLAAFAGGAIGDYMRSRKELRAQEQEKRQQLVKDERDVSIDKSVDLRRDRDDEIIDRKDRAVQGAKRGIKNLFSRKQQPEIEYSGPGTGTIDYDGEDWASDMTGFLVDLEDVLVNAIQEGMSLGFTGESAVANREFEDKSKLKRDTDTQKKNDSELIKNTNETAQGTRSIASDISETKQMTEESVIAVKETAEATKKIRKFDLAKGLFLGALGILKFVVNNQDDISKGVHTVFGKYRSIDEKLQQGVKKVSKVFDVLKDRSGEWKGELISINQQQLSVQQGILDFLIGTPQHMPGGGPPPPPSSTGPIPLLGSYAKGTDYVPQTGPYLLHQGEKVTPVGNDNSEELRAEDNAQMDRVITPLEGMYELMLMESKANPKGGSKANSKAPGGIKNALLDQAKGMLGMQGGVKGALFDYAMNKTGIKALNTYETVNISDASIKDLSRAMGNDGGILDMFDVDRKKSRGGVPTGKGSNIPEISLPDRNVPQLPAPEGTKPKGKLGKVAGALGNVLSVRKWDVAGLGAGLGASMLAADMIGKENDPGGIVSKGVGLATDIGVSMGIPALLTKLGGFSGIMAKIPVLGEAATGLMSSISASGSGLLSSLTAAGSGIGGASLATTLGGVGVAGAAGYGVGTLINEGIDASIKKLTGGKNTSLGEWIYDVTHPSEIQSITPQIERNAKRTEELNKLNTDIKDMKESGNAKMIASSVSNAVTNIGGSTTNISMPVSAYDSDRGTNLLSANLAS